MITSVHELPTYKELVTTTGLLLNDITTLRVGHSVPIAIEKADIVLKPMLKEVNDLVKPMGYKVGIKFIGNSTSPYDGTMNISSEISIENS